MNIIAWVVVILSAVGIVGGVFLIGKPRDPMSPGGYLLNGAAISLDVILAGRILGWW